MISKVIIVIDHLGTGGAQQQVLEYLKYANRSRFDIKLINLDQTLNAFASLIKALGYEIWEIPHQGFLNLKTLQCLIRIFKSQRPDIVHTYLFTADCYGRLAARLAGVKTILSAVRNIDSWMKPHHRFVDKTLSRFTDGITINAEIIRPYLAKTKGIDPAKIHLIYNGIDTRRFEGLRLGADVREELRIPLDARVVGMIGRFSEQKDFSSLFKAAQEVLKNFSNTYFLAVGDGPLKARLQEEVKALGISKNVIFTGLRKDVPDLIQALDIGILASHIEGCPNVILEFMAGSKPVIATDVGGCKELVVSNQTGFIVPQSDFRAIASKIVKLLLDDKKRTAMGQNGRCCVEENFTSQIMARNTEQYYEKFLQPKIAFIFSQFPAYDETFILREMNQLKAAGLNFRIYSLKNPKDKIIHEEANALAAETVYLPFFSFKFILIKLFYFLRNPARYIALMISVLVENSKSPEFFFKTLAVLPKAVGLAWIARKNKITLVHGQWATYPATVAYVISKLNCIPFSFTGHAHDIYLDTAMLAFKIKRARFILTCTANNKEYLLGLLAPEEAILNDVRGKILVNRHGIDLTRFECKSPIAGNHKIFTILSVGSLLECKGFNYLIEACRILKTRGVVFQCVIAGGGKLEAQLKDQISSLGLSDHVKLTGYIKQEQLIPLYQKADLFVLSMVPDIHWGIPNVLIEAAACRIPVICTMLPSVPELIVDCQSGFIVPPKDPRSIADAAEKIYKDRNLSVKVIENAYKIVREEYDVVQNADRLKSIFGRFR